LNPNKNADISLFLKKKEGKDISSRISLEFAFTYRKADTFKKIFKLHGNIKTISGMFLITKSLQQRS